MMNSFSLLYEYDFEIQLHWHDLCKTFALCGHILAMKFLLINNETALKANVVPNCTSLFLVKVQLCPAWIFDAIALSSILCHMQHNKFCNCPTWSPWYHQHLLYTHRILFALTALILVHIKDYCLMAPSHYRNWWWQTISNVFWHPSKCSFIGNSQDISLIWVWTLHIKD